MMVSLLGGVQVTSSTPAEAVPAGPSTSSAKVHTAVVRTAVAVRDDLIIIALHPGGARHPLWARAHAKYPG
ncbi:hypothetical protein CKY47_22865 [Saccharothrix yanglingensis]|uniref:Uncharacterized protein n=1 Tax=Saccharothrix yanglingensis TaxID=659496 RepID=A0ABU0X448_9PSEU|nr:hypothetical protein [Saccharothrix yanglingensis]